jgi:meso-butanediol dehydrogenase / (S,S)-butanediol dehydrogenase / diacetyl reductase
MTDEQHLAALHDRRRVVDGAATLAGRRVLVTGGTAGVGAALVRTLADHDARVVFTGRDRDRGATLQHETSSTFLPADARDEQAVHASVRAATVTLGGLDNLVCCAGATTTATIGETTTDAWNVLVDVNLTAPYLYSVACLPALRESRGAIVHLAAAAALWGQPAHAAFSVTKAALVMLTRMLAIESGAAGVRANAVCPGAVAPTTDTPPNPDTPPTGQWRVPPLGRVGEATDIVDAVVFLLGNSSSFVNGTTLVVDGGMQASLRSWRGQ